jgi:hypothetical protein
MQVSGSTDGVAGDTPIRPLFPHKRSGHMRDEFSVFVDAAEGLPFSDSPLLIGTVPIFSGGFTGLDMKEPHEMEARCLI